MDQLTINEVKILSGSIRVPGSIVRYRGVAHMQGRDVKIIGVSTVLGSRHYAAGDGIAAYVHCTLADGVVLKVIGEHNWRED